MIRFSPGVAQGCYELLTLARKHSYPAHYFLSSFSHFGSIASEKIFATAQALDWVCVDEHSHLAPTVTGERLLQTNGYSHLLRQMLLDYIDIERPSWVQNAISGRSKVLHFAGSEIGQIFIEANLAVATDEPTVQFWDSLSARARGLNDQRLNAIGRQGERLSLAYEMNRTNKEPRWIALECNEDGYDILSIVDQDDHRKMSIEVKTTTMGKYGSFYLSVNEWERSQEAPHHVFHLWDVSKNPARLSIISPTTMKEHIAINSGQGVWQSVKVPFSAFTFASISSNESNAINASIDLK